MTGPRFTPPLMRRKRAGTLALVGGMAAALFLTDLPTAPAGIQEKEPREKTVGKLEIVATFGEPMPTGVTVSHKGRIFVNFPRWGDKVLFTVAEVTKNGPKAFPSQMENTWDKDRPGEGLLSVQSVVVDPKDRLWALDTGSVEFGPIVPGTPKLVGIDLDKNQVFKTIHFPADVALKKTYLNDIRFDLKRGKEGMAFITDSSGETPGLIVVDLATSKSWRRLGEHPSTQPVKNFLPIVEGRPLMERPAGGKPKHLAMGSDGIAISADGQRLYYCPLASRHLYSVSLDALADPNASDAEVTKTVTDHGDRGFASDGLESDDKGRIYLTDYEHNSVLGFNKDGMYETLVHDPRLLWPDTMSVATDGYLYVTANQLHRQKKFHEGKDLREQPYCLFKTKIDAGPVLLK